MEYALTALFAAVGALFVWFVIFVSTTKGRLDLVERQLRGLVAVRDQEHGDPGDQS